MKIPPYWIEKFKSERTWSRRPTEMIKEIQKDAYNSALKDVQGVLPSNPSQTRREDIANAISGLRK